MNSRTFFYYLWNISIGASVLSFIFGIIFVKRIKGYLVPLLVLVALSLGVDLLNLFLVNAKINNFYVLHIYSILEFSLWILFYFMFFKQYTGTYYLFFGLIPIFMIVCYADYKINGLDTMDNFSVSAESLVLTLFSLFSFRLIMNKRIFENLLKAPFFFINVGVLLYFLGNICFFTFANYIYKTEEQNFMASWTLHSILNIIFNLLICVGFWRSKTG
jgi:hypothetical protein